MLLVLQGIRVVAPNDAERNLSRLRDGINDLFERLTGGTSEARRITTAAKNFDEKTISRGLQETSVHLTELTGKGIKVAVLDTGFDDKHPDFLGRLVTTKLFASKSSPDDTHGLGPQRSDVQAVVNSAV